MDMGTPSDEVVLRRFVKMFPFRFSIERAAYLLTANRDASVIDQTDMANPFFGALQNWNCARLKDAIKWSCIKETGIGNVQFCSKGKLLYRSDVSLYNFIALVLGRVNDGYLWIAKATGSIREIFGCRRSREKEKKTRRP